MDKKRNNHGFSLIELIIVIAIMAILVGVLAPQLLRYVETTRRTVCVENMDVILKEYELAVITDPPSDITEAQNILKNIMLSHDAKAVASSSFYNGGVYDDICPSGGYYGCLLGENLTDLSITCYKHGTVMIDAETLLSRLESINFDDLSGFAYKDLAEYFSKNHTSIDSEAVSTNPTSYAPYSSLAEAVSAKLKEQGIDTSNRSWRMYKRDDIYNLFLANQKITLADVGKTITCVKYDVTNGVYVTGTVRITTSANGQYAILEGASFKEQ